MSKLLNSIRKEENPNIHLFAELFNISEPSHLDRCVLGALSKQTRLEKNPACSCGNDGDFNIFRHKRRKLTAASHQSEDQVIERRGGQQEQQDGEEQSPDEELQQAQLQSAPAPQQRSPRVPVGFTWSRS